jgi:hypothetical protein
MTTLHTLIKKRHLALFWCTKIRSHTLFIFAHNLFNSLSLEHVIFKLRQVGLVASEYQTINCLPTMNADPKETLDERWKNFDFANAIGLILLMKEIQEQEPLEDPDILMVAGDGTALY